MIALDVSDDLFTPLCDGCAVPVRGGHRVTPTDVHCDLCGLRLYETVFQDKITFPNPDKTLREEVWVYVPTRKGSTAIDLTAVGRTGVGRARDCDPLVDWENTKLLVHVPKSGLLELAVVPQSDMLPPHVNVRCQIPASVVNGLEPQGLRCSLKLVEKTKQSNRIVRLIPRPEKTVEVVSPGRNVLESPLIAYMDASGALLRLEVHAPESVVHIRRLTTPPDKRSALITNVGLLPKESEVVPGINLRKGDCRSLVLRLKIDKPSDKPVPLRLDLDLLGLPLVSVDLNVLVRPAPELSFEPKTQPRHELLIGFTKGLSLFVASNSDYPQTVEVSLKVDPADAKWIDFLVRPPARLSLDNPVELYLEMRTAHLPRATFDGRELSATVEVRDQSGHVWKYPIRAVVRRMPPMRAPLSLDWGTTNTCAAWHDGSDSRPITVPLDPNELIASRQESIPSDIYFKDVSDPKNPDFLIGYDARNLSRNDQRSTALLISLKRQFARGGTVYVMDRAGKKHTYPVEDLVRRVIGKLVRMAELVRQEEVKTFSVTFPTKWSVQARRRLAKVLVGVRDDLCSGNGGKPDVVALSPRIDEANACVLNLLDELNREGKLQKKGEKVELVVAAYDFGGGTIDTSIFRVTIDHTADVPLRTNYIGVGGNAEFGGDDVTRAVMFLIVSRLKPFLTDIEGLTDVDGLSDTNRRTYQLPLLPSGDSPPRDVSNPAMWYEIGRSNWDMLWGSAEEIKAKLCRNDEGATNKRPVEYYLDSRLECYLSGGQANDKFERQKLKTVLNTQDNIESELFEALEFNLEAVYAFAPPTTGRDLTTAREPKSVREEVESVARELADQCELAKCGPPDYVVLAGGGSRLPLAIESLIEHLRVPAERIIYVPDYLKQRVAHGNAWYISHTAAGLDLEAGLCASVDILHRPLAFKSGVFQPDRIVVRTGVPIHCLKTWYDFPLAKNLVRAASPREMILLSIGWAGTRRQSNVLGAFDLESAETSLPGDDPTDAIPLPTDLWEHGTVPVGHIRLRHRASDDPFVLIELCVTTDRGRWGPYHLVPATIDEERYHNELQGPGFQN